jgi:murein DD-endopeptidase MepM/ murein hydrolase activator NlpD
MAAQQLARTFVALGLLLLAGLTFAQALYKYRGADGEWVFTDRKPEAPVEIEVRELSKGLKSPNVSVFFQNANGNIQLFARNEYHAPVQVVLGLDELQDVEVSAGQSLRFVVPPRDETFLMSLAPSSGAVQPSVAYRYLYLIGDPAAKHEPEQFYRVPFAVARDHPISQAYPYAITHTTPDSYYAVDIAMPIGTNVYAARGGTVIDVASTNFRGGLDPTQDGAEANLIRILHADGTYAIYAHLNWNTIRVRPGDEVERGEYIADSGNTGFSTGPHLHFAVIRNAGMRSESVPITFEGPDGAAVVPEIGNTLIAY